MKRLSLMVAACVLTFGTGGFSARAQDAPAGLVSLQRCSGRRPVTASAPIGPGSRVSLRDDTLAGRMMAGAAARRAFPLAHEYYRR